MEAERSDVQGHLCLRSKHKADLDYMTAHLEKDSGAPQPRTKSSHRFLSADFALGVRWAYILNLSSEQFKLLPQVQRKPNPREVGTFPLFLPPTMWPL